MRENSAMLNNSEELDAYDFFVFFIFLGQFKR